MRKLALIGFLGLFFQGAFGFEPLASIWVDEGQPEVLRKLADRYEVIEKEKSGYVLLVPPRDLVGLLNQNPGIRIEEANIYHHIEESIAEDPGYLAGYRTFAEIEATLSALVETYPDLVHLETYGE